MAENQIQKMRVSHEAILDWLILNPDKTQGQCAEEFNVTEAWLSVIVNSDVFKARWRERRQQMDGGINALIEAKAKGVVAAGLERLERLVPVCDDPRLVLDTTDKLLGRLGYGPKAGAAAAGVNVTVNTFQVSKDVLAEARARIAARGQELAETAQPGLPAPEDATVLPLEIVGPVEVPRDPS